MTEGLQEVLVSYLRYHRIEGSTVPTVKFYVKELGLFLRRPLPSWTRVRRRRLTAGDPAIPDASALAIWPRAR